MARAIFWASLAALVFFFGLARRAWAHDAALGVVDGMRHVRADDEARTELAIANTSGTPVEVAEARFESATSWASHRGARRVRVEVADGSGPLARTLAPGDKIGMRLVWEMGDVSELPRIGELVVVDGESAELLRAPIVAPSGDDWIMKLGPWVVLLAPLFAIVFVAAGARVAGADASAALSAFSLALVAQIVGAGAIWFQAGSALAERAIEHPWLLVTRGDSVSGVGVFVLGIDAWTATAWLVIAIGMLGVVHRPRRAPEPAVLVSLGLLNVGACIVSAALDVVTIFAGLLAVCMAAIGLATESRPEGAPQHDRRLPLSRVVGTFIVGLVAWLVLASLVVALRGQAPGDLPAWHMGSSAMTAVEPADLRLLGDRLAPGAWLAPLIVALAVFLPLVPGHTLLRTLALELGPGRLAIVGAGMLLAGETVLLRWGVGAMADLVVWASPGLTLAGVFSAAYMAWLSCARGAESERLATVLAFSGAIAWTGVGSCTWYGVMGSAVVVLGAAIAAPAERVLAAHLEGRRGARLFAFVLAPIPPAPIGWGTLLVIWGVASRAPWVALGLAASAVVLVIGLARPADAAQSSPAGGATTDDALSPSMWATLAMVLLLSVAPGAAWSRLSPPIAHLADRLEPPGGLRVTSKDSVKSIRYARFARGGPRP